MPWGLDEDVLYGNAENKSVRGCVPCVRRVMGDFLCERRVPLGHFATPINRLLAFPNSRVPRLGKMNTGEKQRRSRILAFFLVRPNECAIREHDRRA
eukprot:scaffold131_cov381-Pinguiococcus_pyrenoidosus.AAC.8